MTGTWDISFHALQAALLTLLAGSPLTAGYRVYDDVPPDVAWPFVRLGTPSGVRDIKFGAQDVWAEDVVFQLDVFSDYSNNAEVEDMLSNISRAISGGWQSMTVSGWRVILTLIDHFEVLVDSTEPTHLVRHGILRYRFHMEPTS